jgi:hypothetical protein
MKKYLVRLLTPKVIVAAIFVATSLFIISFILILFTAPPPSDLSSIIAVATVKPYTTTNNAYPVNTNDPYVPTPTPTLAPGQISIGSVVQVTNTEGTGLRFRAQPSLVGKEVFMGFDTEAFKVVDGPKQVDGYTWYFLASINNENRTGWAVTNYLKTITDQ